MKINSRSRDLVTRFRQQRLPLCLVTNILLSGVLMPAAYAQDSNTASLTIEVMAEFVPSRGTKYKVTQYADEQCSKRGKTDRLLEKRNAKGKHIFEPLIVDTDSNFIFQVMFEQKKLRQLKSCSSIANLEMQAGHEYKAVYEVSGEVLGCSLTIFDLSAEAQVAEVSQDAQSVEEPSLEELAEDASEVVTEEAQVEDDVDTEAVDAEIAGADTQDVEQYEPEAQLPDAEPVPQGPVQVEYKAPELACLKIGKTGFKNSVPVHSALELKF